MLISLLLYKGLLITYVMQITEVGASIRMAGQSVNNFACSTTVSIAYKLEFAILLSSLSIVTMTVFVCPLYVYFDMRINNKKPFELN